MCFVSNISDGYYGQIPFVPLQNWPPQQVIDLSEVIRRLDDIDKKLGLRDCMDDQKQKFMDELNIRLTKIENSSKKKEKK